MVIHMNSILSQNIREFNRKVQDAFEKNRMTFLAIILYTIGKVVFETLPYSYYRNIPREIHLILKALLFFSIPSLFVEIFFSKKKVICICGYIIAFVFSGAAAICTARYANIQIAGFRGKLISDYAGRFVAGILLMLSVAIIYRSYRKSKLRLEEYVVKVFYNITKALIICFALLFGIVFICAIMGKLFFTYFYLIGRAAVILVLGFYLAPKMILAFQNVYEEPGEGLCYEKQDINAQEDIRKKKSIFKNHKVTLSIILLCTIVEAFIAAVPYEYYENFDFLVFNRQTACRALLYLIIPSLFLETYFAQSKVKSICGYMIAIIISRAVAPLGDLYIFSRNEFDKKAPYEIAQILHSDGALIKEAVGVYLCGIFLAMFAAIVYKYFNEAKLPFKEYVKRVFLNILKTLNILIILEIFCAYVDSVMAEEFFYRYYFDMSEQVHGMVLILDTFYFGPVGVLVLGLYLGPQMILAFRNMDGETGETLFTTIVWDTLRVIVFCAAGYAYFYMLVILVSAQMKVFAVISALFGIGLAVVILAGSYINKTKYRRIVSILYYLFIPLICFQGYDVIVRICRYGITPERYVGTVLIIFEIGTFFIRYFMKGRYGNLIAFFGLLVVITFYIPNINMNSVSNRCQMSLLKEYYQAACDGDVTSKLAYERLKNSYSYLSWQDEMREEIEAYDIYEKSFAVRLKEQYPAADLTRSDYHFITCTHMADAVGEAGYSYASWVIQNSCYNRDGEDKIDVDFSCFQFIDSNTREMIIVDISNFVEKGIAYERAYPDVSDGQGSDFLKEYSRIELDADTVLYISKFDVMYDAGIRNAEPYFEWVSINISGILLEK